MRGGGLANLLFMLPLLIVFGVFSWNPIVQSIMMSFQKTNLITSQFVGIDNFVNVLSDPLLGRAVLNTLYFAVLALVFGFPLPILLAVLMSEVRRGKGLYSALAYLPVIIPPVVAVLLWKFFYDASPTGVFNTIIGCGRHPAAALDPECGLRYAVPRARGDLGGGGRQHHHLSGGPARASRPSSTTRPRWTAHPSGARSGMSRCRSCAV